MQNDLDQAFGVFYINVIKIFLIPNQAEVFAKFWLK